MAMDLHLDIGLAVRALTATQRSFTIADLTEPETPLVFVNPAFERLTGYSAKDALGRNCRFMQGPGTDLQAVAEMRTALAGRQNLTVTILNYRKDGSSFWNEVSMAPLYSEDGVATHMVGVQTDVTAEVLARRDLEAVYASERIARDDAQAATTRLEAMLLQLPVGAHIAEAPSGQLVSGNSQMEKIWRHPFVHAADISEYGRYVAYDIKGERYLPTEMPLARSLRTGEVITDEEMIIERGDGTSGVILAHSAPVHDGSGTIVAAIMLFDDITERKQAEEELRMERERSVALAQTLQRSLLPAKLPKVFGLDFGAAYKPVGVGLEVGGDFYDVFEQPDGECVVLIGDVMGKGAEAATVTSLARHALRTAALRSRRPATLLNVLNQALLREGEGRPFATVAACVLSTTISGARATLGLAGHPRPFLVRANGTVEQVGTAGTLMGVVYEVAIHDVEFDLGVGDILVMFTDGATEATNEGNFLGEEGLRSIICDLAGQDLNARDMAEGVRAGVMNFTGAELKDDLAVLVTKVTAGHADRPHL